MAKFFSADTSDSVQLIVENRILLLPILCVLNKSKISTFAHFLLFSEKISKFSDPPYAQLDGPKNFILFFSCSLDMFALNNEMVIHFRPFLDFWQFFKH